MLPFWLYAICQYNNLVFFTYDMDYSQYILCCAYKHLYLLNYLKLSPFKNGIFSQVNTLFASTKVPKTKALLKIPSNRSNHSLFALNIQITLFVCIFTTQLYKKFSDTIYMYTVSKKSLPAFICML